MSMVKKMSVNAAKKKEQHKVAPFLFVVVLT